MATKRNGNGQKKEFKRDLYVRSEVRFADRMALDLVKRAAKAAGAKSMNAWITSVLIWEAINVLNPPKRQMGSPSISARRHS